MPPSKWNSSLHSPPRSSVMRMRSAFVRNAVSRRRWRSVSRDHSISSKISASGMNEIVVPVSASGHSPITSSSLCGTPRAKVCRYCLPSRQTVGDEPLREGVDDRDADAVEAARDLVALAAELAAGVEHREHDREGREALVLDHVDGDAAARVADRDRVVGVERDLDGVVVPAEGLVDGVVDDLVHEVVETPRPGGADVHPGAEPDRLEALEDGDVLCGVRGLGHTKKALQKGLFWAFNEVYQNARSARRSARLAAIARAAISRSSGSSIAAVSAPPRRRRAGDGPGRARTAVLGVGRPGRERGRERTAARPERGRRALRGGDSRISGAMRPSSNAQVDEVQATRSVPSRLRRSGQACRAIAVARRTPARPR